MGYGVGVRITGGRARSRRLSTPRGPATRPTAERVREALFSILGEPAADARVLDLFAGAGTLGLEALSRGARSAVFVDSSKTAAKFIRRNASDLDLEGASEVHCADVLRVLPRLTGTFHWVFIDPPYAGDLAARTLEALGSGELLGEDAVVIVEHDRRQPTDPTAGCLVKADRRRYGDTELSFYRGSGG